MRLVFWIRSHQRLGLPAEFTLTHSTEGLAGRTLCGIQIPARAVYPAATERGRGPTCSNCIKSLALLEAKA